MKPTLSFRGISFCSVFASPGAAHFFEATMVTEPLCLFGSKTSPRRIIRRGAGVILESFSCASEAFPEWLSRNAENVSKKPFFITLASGAETANERLVEFEKMCGMLAEKKSRLGTPFGIMIVFPDDALGEEIKNTLAVFSSLSVPLVPRISVQMSPEIVVWVSRDSVCDAIALSNGIAWKDFPQEARKVFFRTIRFPLFGRGAMPSVEEMAVSGKYLLPFSLEWLRQAKRQGIEKPVIVGGCVLRPRDAAALASAGVEGIMIDAALALRPWNIPRIIRRIQRSSVQ